MIVILIGLFVPGLSFGIGTIIIGLLIILISEIRPGATQPEHTVTCQACGHQNSEKAEFCENCGTKLNRQQVRCGICGLPNDKDAKFCHSCGARLIQQIPIASEYRTQYRAPCPYCGWGGNKLTYRFCTHCGRPLNPMQTNGGEESSDTRVRFKAQGIAKLTETRKRPRKKGRGEGHPPPDDSSLLLVFLGVPDLWDLLSLGNAVLSEGNGRSQDTRTARMLELGGRTRWPVLRYRS
jgi:hypothetical protein